MNRTKRLLLAGAGILIVAALLLGGNTLRNAERWQPVERSPDQLLAQLEAGWRLIRPPGAGPHPAAILLSGCDGVHDNMEYWASVLVRTGRAALILDSHGPRGLDRLQRWRTVCAAQVMTGAERASDVAVALEALRQTDGIDAQNVALLGASHGGWTVMEFLQLAAEGNDPPPGLDRWPARPDQLLAQIGQVILLYPYCGVISRAAKANWPVRIDGLMVLAERDRIVNPELCRKMAGGLQDRGARLRVQILPGADHGFDQRERSKLSPLEFDQRHTDAATSAVLRLLGTAP